MVKVEINGKEFEASAGEMLIKVADDAGVHIPRFCYHEKLSIAANCRMCLVEVEKAPKALPACATPVMDGMKVWTKSPAALQAQKSTMEFLLINHPLDCPVCDQGGECPLQDQALGYGKDVSRYSEAKRVVENKDIGPLIATEMTRCIHCTRCVRFGQEIAGIMEIGATGRGEHTEIGTFIGGHIDSEVSGNMIDLCPVGALTSKPFRFSARSWEMENTPAISPHDCLGTNIMIQSLRGKVMRVLPRTNAGINEEWISDRDRFSYQALNAEDRLTTPLIREQGEWQQTDWQTALCYAAEGLNLVAEKYGADELAALASPISTLEEFYLLQKLMRGLGCNHVDHRLRQQDFALDQQQPLMPGLGQSIEALEKSDAILLIGSNIRKDQALLGLRVRKASLAGAQIASVGAYDHDTNFAVKHNCVVAPSLLPGLLASIAKALAQQSAGTLLAGVDAWVDPQYQQIGQDIANLLRAGKHCSIIVGSQAQADSQYSIIRALAEQISTLCNAKLGILPDANSAAAWLAGCIPHRSANGVETESEGDNVADLFATGKRAYLIFAAEPELDCINGHQAGKALKDADFVVSLSPYFHGARDYADVILPVAPFSETSGTFVNCEGKVQSVKGAVKALGESRPGWKVLRVLANQLQLDGFDYVSTKDIRDDLNLSEILVPQNLGYWEMALPQKNPERSGIDLERIYQTPLYAADSLVRRAPSLQQTRDNIGAESGRVNPRQLQKLGLQNQAEVSAHVNGGVMDLKLVVDKRVPPGCIYLPLGYTESVAASGNDYIRVVKA